MRPGDAATVRPRDADAARPGSAPPLISEPQVAPADAVRDTLAPRTDRRRSGGVPTVPHTDRDAHARRTGGVTTAPPAATAHTGCAYRQDPPRRAGLVREGTGGGLAAVLRGLRGWGGL